MIIDIPIRHDVKFKKVLIQINNHIQITCFPNTIIIIIILLFANNCVDYNYYLFLINAIL